MRDFKILLVEDEKQMSMFIEMELVYEGYDVDLVADGISAIKHLRRYEYHLAILDIRLPELDGTSVCRQIRKMSDVPFVVISTDSNQETKLQAFSLGAEDYIIKPFSQKELLARLKVILRRGVDKADLPVRNLVFEGLCIDTSSHTVFVNDKKVLLTPKEFQLQLLFAKNPNQAFSREMLLDEVWGQDYFGTDRTVDTHIKTLREALQPRQYYISTIRGVGYKFDEIYK